MVNETDNSMPDLPHTPKIIFIASSSRSGSTVLDQTLGSMEGVFSAGELRRLKDFANLNKDSIKDPANQVGCTCGSKVLECEFWKKVGNESGIDLSKAKFSSQMGPLNRALFKVLFFLVGPRITKRLSKYYQPFSRELSVGDNCFEIYSAIAKITKVEYVVDSSKMIHQFLILKTVNPEKVCLLALFRDGRAVSKSMVRGERKKAFKGGQSYDDDRRVYSAAVSAWVKSALQIILYYLRLSEEEKYFVKYEEFCGQPSYYVKAILYKFGMIDVESRNSHEQKQSHNIGGSPSRFNYDLDGIRLDDSWRRDWDEDDAKSFGVYGGLINKMLGYKRK